MSMDLNTTISQVYYNGVTDLESTEKALDYLSGTNNIREFVTPQGVLNNDFTFFLAKCLECRSSIDLNLTKIEQTVLNIVFFEDNLNLVGNNASLVERLMNIDSISLMDYYRDYYKNATFSGTFSPKHISAFLNKLVHKVGKERILLEEIFETAIEGPSNNVKTKADFVQFISNSSTLLEQLAKYYKTDIEFFLLDNPNFDVNLSEYSDTFRTHTIHKLITNKNAPRFINRIVNEDSFDACIDVLLAVCEKGRVDLVVPFIDKVRSMEPFTGEVDDQYENLRAQVSNYLMNNRKVREI
jgi:hypothetical protein